MIFEAKMKETEDKRKVVKKYLKIKFIPDQNFCDDGIKSKTIFTTTAFICVKVPSTITFFIFLIENEY